MTRTKKSTRKRDDTYRTDILDKVDMNNERFAAYYQAQRIIPENEWDTFLDTLRQPLPTTFRVAGSRQNADELNSTIKNTYVPTLSNAVFEGETVPPPIQIPWYPEGLAWQFNVPKQVLRKSPEFKKFHSFLVFETEVGNISRQEAVSMLPPLFLEVEPHHIVMDMCAAPGSKTAQLLEALHAHDTTTSTSIPPGLLIANDSDHKRTHLLIHQSSRLPSPALMVTNLDASIYPIIKLPPQTQVQNLCRNLGNKKTDQLLFDRILCDVPCSGDGTMRKNCGIWKHWQPMDGNGLHGLQLRILQRAMRMLKVDGRIVYSTCSMNPVENEAVIAAALNSNSDFELVDVSTKLPELQRRPGISVWTPTVNSSINTTFKAYDDFLKSLPHSASGSGRTDSKMTEDHWPPSNVEQLGLDRCLRIYPHLQDTGGFFVAVLQRKCTQPSDESVLTDLKKREASEPPEVPETKKPRLEDEETNIGKNVNSETNWLPVKDHSDILAISIDVAKDVPMEIENAPKSGQNKGKGKAKEASDSSFKENPYTFLSPDDTILQSCIERLNLTSDFPSSNVLVRNPTGDAVRSLYLTNDVVKTIILHNDYNRIRLTSCGTKVFAKQEAGRGTDAQFRILDEGLPVVLPYTDPKTIMTADISALKTFIEGYYPLCATFSEPFRSAIEERPTGSHIVRFPPGEWGGVILIRDLVVPIWKSNVSVTLMIDKKAKSAMSLRLFGEDITTVGREAAEQKKTVRPNPHTLAPEVTGSPQGDQDDSQLPS